MEAALEERVKIQFLVNPVRITRQGNVLKVECQRNEPGAVDASGRRRPVPVKGSEFTLEVDAIIPAIGEVVEVPSGLGLELTGSGGVKADTYTLAASRQGVFASPKEGYERHEPSPGGTPRFKMPTMPAEERLRGFPEVELGFPEDMARAEARRCLSCDLEEY